MALRWPPFPAIVRADRGGCGPAVGPEVIQAIITACLLPPPLSGDATVGVDVFSLETTSPQRKRRGDGTEGGGRKERERGNGRERKRERERERERESVCVCV